MKVVIVGAGGHGMVVADILCCMREAGQPVELLGFVDDASPPSLTYVLSFPVLPGGISALTRLELDAAIVAIGDNDTRHRIGERLQRSGVPLAIARHPWSNVGRDTIIEPGAVICAGVAIGPASRIGAGAIVNTNASADHHNSIGAYAHVAPGAHLGGMVDVGEDTLIGIGAVVIPGRRIGRRVVIGGGAVVIDHISDNSLAVGVPARVTGSTRGRDQVSVVADVALRQRRSLLLGRE